jgi:23S rRNA (uracil-5-)-methyltransferase RumA
MEQGTPAHRRKKGPRPPLEIETDLREWGSKGAVLADLDGRRVGIDRGIPGERVLTRIDRRRQPWRGVVLEATQPSKARVSPPCPYYLDGCGGCQWQHLEYGAQLDAKRQFIERELASNGLASRVMAMHGMDDPWRYRTTASIALGWEAGFRPRGKRGIIEIHDCLISHPLIGELADRVNGLLHDEELPSYHGKVWLDCTVVGSRAHPTLQLLVQGIEGLTLETHPELPKVADVLAGIPSVSSVAYRHRSGEPVALVGDLMSTIEVAGTPMWLTAGSFSQTNLVMLDRLLAQVRNVLHGQTVRRAADVYGGSGTFALNLADLVESMVLIELDPFGVASAQRTATERGLHNILFLSSHAERALPEIGELDMVVVDPPRSGLGTVVTDAIVAARPRIVLYVSCGPASLARDLAELSRHGYEIASIEGYDFYPQTYHVESLTVLTR